MLPTPSSLLLSPSTVDIDTLGISGGTSTETVTVPALVRIRFFSTPSHLTIVARARRDFTSSPLASRALHDDGAPPDLQANDGEFSGKLEFTIRRVEVGTYWIEAFGETVQGHRTKVLYEPFLVVRSNQPPVLSNLQAPDTVALSSQDQLIQLRVRASDPNGLQDVVRVIFNSYRPNGAPSSGNPFEMYDDGNRNGPSGDEIRGDGIYSLRILLPATTQTGTYRFEFQAYDRAGATSNLLIHRMTVR